MSDLLSTGLLPDEYEQLAKTVRDFARSELFDHTFRDGMDLVEETGLHLIQWRNLNLDPDLYLKTLGGADALHAAGDAIGVKAMLDELRLQNPQLRFGYFNPAWGFEGELPRMVKEADAAGAAWRGTHEEGADKLGTC